MQISFFQRSKYEKSYKSGEGIGLWTGWTLPLIAFNRNFGPKLFCVIFITCFQLIDLMIKHILDFMNWNPNQNCFDLKKGESVHMNDIKLRCLCEDDCTFAQCSITLSIRLRRLPKFYHRKVCEKPSCYLRHFWGKADRMNKRTTPIWKDWGWTSVTELSLPLHIVKWELGHFTR